MITIPCFTTSDPAAFLADPSDDVSRIHQDASGISILTELTATREGDDMVTWGV